MLKKFLVTCISVSCASMLAAGCAGESKPTEIIRPNVPGSVVLLVEREGGEGPYVEGSKERFKVTASGEAFKTVRWSSNAGAIEANAERVEWTLPSKGTASLSVSVETVSGKTGEGSFDFNVVGSAVVAPGTVVDPRPDVTGSFCKLAFDRAGKGHVIYLNDTHRSLWYASWDGTVWTTEQIDGPGMNNSGSYVSSATMALDEATGTPHVAYIRMAGAPSSPAIPYFRVAYATRANGAWLRELADPSGYGQNLKVSIALNPAQALQPSIAFSDSHSGIATGVQVTTRTGVGTWTAALMRGATLMGDVTFDSSGTLYVPFANSSTNDIFVGVKPGADTDNIRLTATYSDGHKWLSTAWGENRHLLLLGGGGSSLDGAQFAFYDLAVASPYLSSTVRYSQVDYKNHASAVAYGAGKVFIVQRHETTLELLTPDANSFWTYTQLGSAAALSRPSVAVRPTDGTPHVCYQLDGKLNFQ
ncbi:hypothetical protein MYSTI_04319 [Myxococcus stipitatus DSM 14675]|uniref:Lipoprotein n=1 Tax=Myxococcus stipitatus (strain DSM 14675 / JCM 12634 / Mx s8) TaxID=1278073 RepID=L7UDD1_MYXSD|nr:hypothetical protein [Myxococcus stipitatus]AGC45617.1 hypothetical protein MYSTI_04319 [Myxococcus stipitatus DSM 14675]